MTRSIRWLMILLPVVLIGVIDVASDRSLDELLPSPFDALVGPALVLALALVAARIAFPHVDRLESALRERNEALERRNEALQALREVGSKISSHVAIDDVLGGIVRTARTLLGADAAVLTLVQPDASHRLAAKSGDEDAFPTGAPPAEAEDPASFVDPAHVTVRLAAPLQRGSGTIGMLLVGARKRPRPFGPEDFETLSSLAAQAAVAIENDRLQQGMRELAIRGERERIAREMHDGLAQVLGYVNTKAQAAEELIAVGQTDRARRHLADLSAAARSVYVDVREAILGLTSPIAPERGIVGALEEYASRFAEASKIPTSVQADATARALRLRPDVQAQVFRIAQEALTNVRKHAAAQRARVTIGERDGELELLVTDDGRGLAAASTSPTDWPHYGMQAIRDRAASIGASASWSAANGSGTAFRLTLPLRPRVLEVV
ncbi:MAG: GAF domain-containing protein [Chloroflexota bacterium]|nr:GAF domain-containing protein [Chloroflexota bacterium]MDE3194528.1 GAF domain-containing protein [Chloroflexota bacterium]